MAIIARFVDRWLAPRVLLADRISYGEPRELGIEAEEVEIRRPGGGRLGGLWVAGPGGGPAILFCPGNSGNLSGHLAYVEILHRAGFSVLGFDYSGFGRSGGRPSLAGLIDDGLAALDALSSRAAGSSRLGVFGVSLGANLAIELAARRPEVGAVAAEGLSIQSEMLAGILSAGGMGPVSIESVRDGDCAPLPRVRYRLLRNPFASAAAGRPGVHRARGPGLFARAFSRLAGLCYPFGGKDPRRAAARLGERPVFLIHGADDRLLPFEAALVVRRNLKSRLWLIPEAGHAQEPALLCFEEYSAQLHSFFRGALLGEGLPEPEITYNSKPEGDSYRLELELRGAEGAYLVAVVAGAELLFLRLWAEGEGGGRGSARASAGLRAPAEEAHALRYNLVERRGGSWEPVLGERERAFLRVGERLKRIAAALVEGRLEEADLTLARLEEEELPPSFDLVLRLHRSRIEKLARGKKSLPESRPPRSRASNFAGALLAIASAFLQPGCAGRLSPFPELAPLDPIAALRLLDERASRVQSLYAVVRVAVDSPEMSGAFEVACHYRRPGSVRFSAFKEVLLSTRPIFDLVFTEEKYAVAIHGEKESEFKTGKLEAFPADLARMADLYWLREALFLPGAMEPASGPGGDPAAGLARFHPPHSPGELGAAGTSAHGSMVVWHFDPRTLEVKGATLRPPGRAQPIDIAYGDYRAEGGAFIPGKVAVEDLEEPFAMRSTLRDLEVNPPIDPSVFQLEAPAGARELKR